MAEHRPYRRLLRVPMSASRQAEREIEDEVSLHLELRTEELMAQAPGSGRLFAQPGRSHHQRHQCECEQHRYQRDQGQSPVDGEQVDVFDLRDLGIDVLRAESAVDGCRCAAARAVRAVFLRISGSPRR